MKTYITTIEELKGKPKSELTAMFKKAAEIAATAARQSLEREAASRTMTNICRCLTLQNGP